MSSRRNFLKDVALGIAISLVPKILQPVVPEIPALRNVTKQIARYNARFIAELDGRIFKILEAKITRL